MDYYVHESSIIESGAHIGRDTRIWHFCHVMGTARLGDNCTIGQNVYIGENVVLGSNVKVQNNVSIYSGVTVEDDVFLGPSMVFTNVVNPRSAISRKSEFGATLVQRGASVGANATIVCGVTLGRYCFVGAGAVLTSSVPDYAVAYGNPARVQGWMCQCGHRLDFKVREAVERAVCADCGRTYARTGRTVTLLNADEDSIG